MLKRYQNSYFSYFLMYNFYYLSWALFSALISVYLLGKGLKASEVSLIVSMSFLTSMIAQPFIGMLSDRYDAKKVNIVLFVLAALGGLFFAFADNFITMMIGYSFVLMLINGTNPIMEKIATASPYRYGKIRIWGTIGYALGSQFAGLIYDYISPKAIFLIFILTMILTIIGTYGTQPDMHVEHVSEEKVSTKELLKNKKYIYFLVISAIFYGATNMANTYVPSMFVHDGLPVGLTSTLLSIAVICETPIVLFSNKFMDKLSNKTLLIVAYVVVCLQFLSYGLNMSIPIKMIMTFIAKHPAGMLYIMINLKVVHTIVDEHQIITALAFVATIKNLVSIVSQNIAGYILDYYSYSVVFLIFFAVLVVGLILTILYKIDRGDRLKLFE